MIRPVRPIGPVIWSFRRKRADGQTDEQHGADAEREAAEVDLADQIADADGEKYRKDRLRPDDVREQGRS